jgi:phosphoglycolate phosphatase
MTGIRGLLFDKDGTLFDFMATWGQWTRDLLDDLAAGSADLSETLARAVGYDRATGSFAADSPVIAHTPAEIADALLPHLPGSSPMALVARMNALSATAGQVEAVPLAPLFRQFRDMGYRIGLVTNDSEEPARAHLARAGLTPLFDYVAGSDSGHGAKPEPGPLLAFAGRFGLRPAEVLMVGDSRHDLVAGRAAGMQTAGVLTGLAGRGDLDPLADVVLPDIGHLPLWLERRKAVVPAG